MIEIGSYSDKINCAASTATSVQWFPINVCRTATKGYIKYSADSNNNIYTSPYSDSACMTSSGADVKATTVACTSGVSFTVYSATQPDAIFNVKSSGYVSNVGYASTDTMCTSTPTVGTYFPIRTCTQNTATYAGGVTATISTQYFVDAR